MLNRRALLSLLGAAPFLRLAKTEPNLETDASTLAGKPIGYIVNGEYREVRPETIRLHRGRNVILGGAVVIVD